MWREERVHDAFTVTFPNRRSARAVEVDLLDDIARACVALGLTARPTLVVVGGADGLTDRDADEVRPLFLEVIAPLIDELGGQVIDGGTDVGVMRLIGRARAELELDFPLVGVAAVGNVAVPGRERSPAASDLEPNHSHFLLVAGAGWGRETPWIAHLATVLAADHPSLTLLVNGGEISWDDASQSIAVGRPVVAVGGSGGAADAVVAQLHGGEGDRRARELASSGLLVAAEASDAGASVRKLLGQLLGATPDG